jgi:hypothetical protein
MMPVRVGGRTPSTEPLLLFHQNQAASTIFALDGRRVGHVEHAGGDVTVFDNDGALVVRVERRGKRTCVVVDSHGSEIAQVSRPFLRETYARVTQKNAENAELRGRPASFRIVDGQTTDLACVRTIGTGRRIMVIGDGRERPSEPLCHLLAAGPWIGAVLAEPFDSD